MNERGGCSRERRHGLTPKRGLSRALVAYHRELVFCPGAVSGTCWRGQERETHKESIRRGKGARAEEVRARARAQARDGGSRQGGQDWH